MDSSDSEEERGVRAPPGIRRIALQDFFRELRTRHAAQSNEEMVERLSQNEMLRSDAVRRALLVCPRALFVPPAYRDQAYADAPIRVEELGFNISAPHMHSTALSTLDLQPGDRVLDVGSGCGVVSAAAAFLVGTSGEVVGIDIRQACVDMCERNCLRLREENTEFAEASAPVCFMNHNVFIPTAQLASRFTKIHVGATCPSNCLKQLLKLLAPEGGAILAPVDQELLMLTRDQSGAVRTRVISQVRFTELEVPRDVDIVLSMLHEERQAARVVKVPPSSFEADLVQAGVEPSRACLAAVVVGSQGGAGRPPAQLQPASECTAAVAATTQGAGEPTTAAATAAAAAAAAAEEEVAGWGEEGKAGGGGVRHVTEPEGEKGGTKRHKTGGPTPPLATPVPIPGPASLQQHLDFAQQYLGLDSPDCELTGDGGATAAVSAATSGKEQQLEQQQQQPEEQAWKLPAHRALLAARCEHFRARFDSGMRDAAHSSFPVPEGVGAPAAAALLQYVYTDQVAAKVPLELMGELLHLSAYYGCPHLAALCEARLLALLLAPAASPTATPSAAATAASTAAAQQEEGSRGAPPAASGAATEGAAAGAAAGSRAASEVAGGPGAAEEGRAEGGGHAAAARDGVRGESVGAAGTEAAPLLASGNEQEGQPRAMEGRRGPSPAAAKRDKKERWERQLAQERAEECARAAAVAAAQALADDLAAQLLLLAEEARLGNLKRACLSYIAERFEAVRASASWAALPRSLVDEVAGCCHAQSVRMLHMLLSLSRDGEEGTDLSNAHPT